jgi:predicted dithiol-disulfide oxidoreductase (DUF899 family)
MTPKVCDPSNSQPILDLYSQVVSPSEWLTARKELLVKEKAATRASDALSAQRRELPMVKVTKPYTFEGPQGSVSLADLFEGRKQLIIYHFMLGPDWEEGCSGKYPPFTGVT